MISINKNWNSLIKPSKLKCEYIDGNPNSVQITAEPLEPGMAITIANSLRRVLLSSLQGAAIISMKVSGVEHEFANIPGVKEDITDIILNLKNVVIRMLNSEKRSCRISAFGPCVVTAAMIEGGSDIEVINPEHKILTLDKGFSLDIELVCQTGKGYVPASSLKPIDSPIGVIYIDALFSPVKNVAYKIGNARVGQMTNYDKLTMDVETNGSVTPEMSVALAARILQDQMQMFVTFDDVEDEKKEETHTLPFDSNLLKKVDELELSVRSHNCLKNDNIVYIGDLVCKTESEMLKTPNFGRKSLNEIRDLLSGLGLKFGMQIPGWPPENVEELAKKYEEPY